MISRFAFGTGVLLGAALIVQLGRQNEELRARYDALREQVTVAKPGYSVPTFESVTLEGDSVQIGGADGDEHQLAFVFTAECPYCQASVSSWNRITRSVDDAVFTVGLSQSSPADTRDFVRIHGLAFPVTLFPEKKLVRLFRAGSVPLIMLLDPTGRVRYSRLGVLPADSDAAVDSVLTAVAAELASWEERATAADSIAAPSSQAPASES